MMNLSKYEVRTRAERDTSFVCPHCGADREGRVMQRTRWMTGFDRPVLPVETLDSVVECSACGHEYDMGSLDVPTTRVLAQYAYNATRAAVATIVRAGLPRQGDVDPGVCELAVALVNRAGHGYDGSVLDDDLDVLTDAETMVHLGLLVDEMTTHGKEAFLHQLMGIACTDGPATTGEQRAIFAIGVALGMTERSIDSVLEAVR